MVDVQVLEFYFLQESSGWRVLHEGSVVVLKKSAVFTPLFQTLLLSCFL